MVTNALIATLPTTVLITRCTRCVSFNRATNSPILRVSKNGLGRSNNAV